MILVLSDAAVYIWLAIILVCASLTAHTGDYEPLVIMLSAFVSMMTAFFAVPFYMQTALFVLALIVIYLIVSLITVFIR